MLSTLPPGLERPVPPTLRHSCREADDAAARLLLVGPRLTGPGHAMIAGTRWLSASSLLDEEISRDDIALFRDRVVFVGATHSGSGDFWLTPGGVLTGVELLANTVRFAPLQTTGIASEVAYRGAALLVFFMFAMFTWLLRGIVAILASIFAVLMFAAVIVGFWDYLRVFAAIEAALLLTLQYKALEALLNLVEAWKQRGGARGGIGHAFRTLGAVCIKDHDNEAARHD
jgi:hypothetical protein